MDLILLRHGETLHNVEGRYSTDDCPLSEEGILQIERAANKLNKLIVDRVWLSPLKRTRETFDIIRKYHSYPFEIKDEIQEINAGHFRGKTFKEGMELYPKEVEEYMRDYINNPLPGGESIIEAYDRAGQVLRSVRKSSGNILMVTHGGFISLILANILGDVKNYSRFEVENGSFTLIKMDNFPRIKFVNRL